MRYTPKTAKEIEMEGVLPAGTYPFTVYKAEDKVSKKGNDMIALSIRVHADNGDEFVNDFLMEAMAFKLAHFCQHTGLESVYQGGNLTADDCVNREGYLKLKIKTDEYGTKNEVVDYVEKPGDAASVTPDPRLKNPNASLGHPPKSDSEDEIPF